MSKVIENMVNQAAREAVKAKSVEVALIMISDGKLSLDLIAKYSGLTLEEVESLSKKQSA